MAEPESAEQLAEVVILREGDEVQVVENPSDDVKAIARLDAAKRKALFTHMVKGAETRAGALPRSMTAALATGVANLMLAEILHGNVQPQNAREAAAVAKVAHEIAKDTRGEVAPADLTDEERAEKMKAIAELEKTLAERAAAAEQAHGPVDGDDLGGPIPEDDVEHLFEFDEEPDPDEANVVEVEIPDPWND